MIILVILIILQETLSDHVFSSVTEMKTLCHKTSNINQQLVRYQEELEKQMQSIDHFLAFYYQDLESLSQDKAKEYVTNPVNIYRMIDRLSNGMFDLSKHLLVKDIWDIKLEQEVKNLSLPFDELDKAGRSLIDLQNVYQLNLEDLKNGKVLGHQSKATLSGLDLINLADLAMNDKYYDSAYELLKTSINHGKDLSSEIISEIKKRELPLIVQVHDQTLLKKGPLGNDYRTFMKPLSKSLKKTKIKKMPKVKLFQADLSNPQVNQQFKKLCQGQDLRSPKDDINTKCFYHSGSNPFLRLAPFKIEALGDALFQVNVVHDFISNQEVNKVINTTLTTGLERSTLVNGYKKKKDKRYAYRTSKQVWLDDEQFGNSVSSKIEQVTKLNVNYEEYCGEKYQVANYGIGGVYKTHVDFKYEDFADSDPRLMTFMIYLTDVAEGGATVFPYTGLRVNPEKGKAVFWYNIDPVGNELLLSGHGACPVLKGSKWIANKWIQSTCNFNIKPCPMEY